MVAVIRSVERGSDDLALQRGVLSAEERSVRAGANAGTKVCPHCAETVKAAAIMCRFCRYEFTQDEPAT